MIGFKAPLRLSRVASLIGAAGILAVAVAGTGYVPVPPEGIRLHEGENPGSLSTLERRARSLRSEIRKRGSGPPYIVVDSAQNRIYVRRGDEVLVDALCSAGTGLILRVSDQDRQWTFDTPRGIFEVLHKTEDPVWRKPDWAFLEEGEPVPEDPSERFEYGSLGEYGLYFGDGYLIHGTLYERLLGRNVTHGCIRVGREDLRRIYRLCPVGTRILIH